MKNTAFDAELSARRWSAFEAADRVIEQIELKNGASAGTDSQSMADAGA